MPKLLNFFLFSLCTITQDWLRIGSFLFESPVALMTESLNAPLRVPKEETVEKMLNNGCCLLENIKTGIWLAGNTNMTYL